MISRRQSLGLLAGCVASTAYTRFSGSGLAQASPVFKLPPLPYAFEALEPNIDATTMMIHHDRHHAAYVAALNGLVEKYPSLSPATEIAILSRPDTAPEAVRSAVRNNLGGHFNHSFFWELMTPGGAKQPEGELKSAINGAFGDVEKLTQAVTTAGLSRFGSGWAWLVVDKTDKLTILSTANQDTPLELGAKRIVLGVDVWEHAYYLKYQNRRADYLKAWWSTVNWDRAAANFSKAPA